MDIDLVATNWSGQIEIAISVAIAGMLAGLIGFERELAERPAGLRTHAVLGAAAALLVGVSETLIEHFVSVTAGPAGFLRADPLRVVEAIVTGVAFLGAGTIFRGHTGGAIEGLTTAAGLLLVAAIGVAVALDQLLLAVLVTAMTLVLLRVLGRLVGTSKGNTN